ncbi:GNAT family N-acetyltransferase [Embleya sp. NPDC001921]
MGDSQAREPDVREPGAREPEVGEPDVRVLREIDEFRDVEHLYGGIWPAVPGQGLPVTVELMRALSHAGNYVAGAYRAGRMVGATVAFLGAPIGETLHSHVTGALAGSGAGFALKTHQREWALARGLRRITWTYDPLIRRNAHFNLTKLGARPVAYLPDFYGDMVDTINSGDESDRLLVSWELNESRVRAAVRREWTPPPPPPNAESALTTRAGRPAPTGTNAETVLIAVPPDIESLRRTDPSTSRAWRTALRDTLGTLLDNGATVLSFDRDAGYVVSRSRRE